MILLLFAMDICVGLASADPKIDSIITYTSRLIDTNYTVPSWTLLEKSLIQLKQVGSQAALVDVQLAIDSLNVKDGPYSIATMFNGNPSSNMGFNWFNNAGVLGGKVEIIEGRWNHDSLFSKPDFTVDAISTQWKNVNYTDGTKKNYAVNKAVATGLKAGTDYSYRVGRGGAWSRIGHFTTAKINQESFSFVYFTDPQANTDAMFAVSAQTLHLAKAMVPNAKFFLSCGDLVETAGPNNFEWEYEQFFKTQQDVWMEYPIVSVLGNHDQSPNRNFTNHFNTATAPFDSAKSTMPGSVYSYVYGDALFLALNFEEYGVAGYLDSLKAWITRQVTENPTVKWRIAFFHKTIYTGSTTHQSDVDGKIVRDVITPLFDSLHIQLALQGHDHIYEVIGPIKGNQLVKGSVSEQASTTIHSRSNLTGKLGGTFNVYRGTLYFLNNSAGKKKYEPRSKAAMAAAEKYIGITNYFSFFTGRFGQNGEPTFSKVTISTDSINIATYAVNDFGVATLFDAFKIVNDSIDPPTFNLDTLFAPNIKIIGKNIWIDKNINNEWIHVTVVDIHGKEIRQKSFSDVSTLIDLPENTSGIVFVRIKALEIEKLLKYVIK